MPVLVLLSITSKTANFLCAFFQKRKFENTCADVKKNWGKLDIFVILHYLDFLHLFSEKFDAKELPPDSS